MRNKSSRINGRKHKHGLGQ